MIITYICIFFIGASIASFLNATMYRVEKKYKYPEIITLGSHCGKCKHQLSWWELIPVLGYLIIKGKCKSCGIKIGIYNPLSELTLGIVALLFFFFPIPWYFSLIFMLLFVLSYHDIKTMSIPADIVHIFLAISTMLFLLFSFNIQHIYAPLIVTAIFLCINLVKKSFGLGDILVLLGIGILLEYKIYLVMFWLGILLALLYSIILIIFKKIDLKNGKVPMVPFFSISLAISLIYGEKIYDLLLKYLGIW